MESNMLAGFRKWTCLKPLIHPFTTADDEDQAEFRDSELK